MQVSFFCIFLPEFSPVFGSICCEIFTIFVRAARNLLQVESPFLTNHLREVRSSAIFRSRYFEWKCRVARQFCQKICPLNKSNTSRRMVWFPPLHSKWFIDESWPSHIIFPGKITFFEFILKMN